MRPEQLSGLIANALKRLPHDADMSKVTAKIMRDGSLTITTNSEGSPAETVHWDAEEADLRGMPVTVLVRREP